MTPSLDRLRTFGVFARHLSFVGAARAVGLSQPALHTQVRLLAEEIGTPLYRRDGRALVLTEAGAAWAAFAHDIEHRVRGLQAPSDRPTVTLAAGEGTFLYLLAPVLAAPPARLRLWTADAAGVVEAVRDGAADLGVTPAEPADDLVAIPLCEVGHVVLVPLDHALAGRREVEPVDLVGEVLAVPPPGRPLRRALDAAGSGWTVGVEASGWELLRQAAQLRLGLAVVNAFCPPPAGVVSVPLRGLPPVRYAAIRRRDAWRTPERAATWSALTSAFVGRSEERPLRDRSAPGVVSGALTTPLLEGSDPRAW